MPLTTLIPTFIHLAIGLFALLIHSAAGKRLADFLKKTKDGSHLRPLLAAIWVEGYIFAVLFAMFGFIWLVQAVAQLPIAHSLYAVTAWAFGLPAL